MLETLPHLSWWNSTKYEPAASRYQAPAGQLHQTGTKLIKHCYCVEQSGSMFNEDGYYFSDKIAQSNITTGPIL